MGNLDHVPTAYEILGVHPSAPTDLISACYWTITSSLQEKRSTEPEADAELHRLTRAYESVSDPVHRAGYNLSIAHTDEPLLRRSFPRRRFFPLRLFGRNRHALKWSVDPHEVLGLHPSAPQATVPIAHRLMRDVYLRLPPESRRREKLLNLLEESYAVLGDPQKRAQLAGVVPAEDHELPALELDDPPVNDLPELSQPDAAKAKVALPSTTPPAPTESPRPPKTPPTVPAEPVVAAGAGRESDDDAHRSAAVAGAASAAAVTVARGVRNVVAAVAATSVVVAGGLATGAQWAALTVAALAVAAARFVARSVRSGWLATREWLRRLRDRRRISVPGSGESSSPPATPDEVFLGRLASTVGKSKTEPRRSSDKTTRR